MVLPEAWVEINQVKKKLGAGKWAWCKAQGYGCKKRRWVESRAWSHKEHIFYQRDLIDPFLPSRDVWIPVRIMKGALRPLLSLTRLAHDFSFYLNDSHKRKSSEAHAWDSRLSFREIRLFLLPTHCGPRRGRRKSNSMSPTEKTALLNPCDTEA